MDFLKFQFRVWKLYFLWKYKEEFLKFLLSEYFWDEKKLIIRVWLETESNVDY